MTPPLHYHLGLQMSVLRDQHFDGYSDEQLEPRMLELLRFNAKLEWVTLGLLPDA